MKEGEEIEEKEGEEERKKKKRSSPLVLKAVYTSLNIAIRHE